VVDAMPREKLREWIADPKTPVNRLGLFGLMLGLCGNADDAEMMRDKILEPSDGFRIGIDGVMTGYVLLTGEQGLEVIEQEKISDKTENFSEHVASMQMLRFLWNFAKDRFDPERIKQSMRLMVENHKIADLVIADLARWEDWETTPRLIALYGTDGYDVPFVERKILYFMWAAVDSKPKEAQTTPEYVQQAQKFLARVEKDDPEIFNQARKTYLR
jgi:hypothetical protein